MVSQSIESRRERLDEETQTLSLNVNKVIHIKVVLIIYMRYRQGKVRFVINMMISIEIFQNPLLKNEYLMITH